MNCPQCGNQIAAADAVCPSCSYVLGTGPRTALGAMTPPDGLAHPHTPSNEEVDGLAIRLQAAIGEHYKVEKPLGAGGFAVVYLVRDLNLKRKLAVKVLSPDLITSKTVMERFRREAETVAQLSHPNIVPLHFIGQKDDLVFLAMECIEGGSLADRLDKEKQLPVEEVRRIAGEVASALAHAHKRGVIHRDIKPQNVLLDHESGRCLVTDFGIARTAESSSLTASGMLVGTPAYLSPEQVTGAVSDHRADIYALGVMAYEMLTGKPPFAGPTPTAVMMSRLAGPPVSITKIRPEVPPALRDVIDGCLAQEPAERFQNAADVVRALGGATPVSAPHATAEYVVKARRKEQRRKAVFALAGAGVLGALALGVALFKGGSDAPPPPPAVDPGMAQVAAGTYSIGLDRGPANARPAHQVTLAAFGLDRHEVTVGAYAAFVDAGRAPAPWPAAMPDSNLPVTRVLWSEAQNYCAWRHPDGGRLPTENEWEASARGAGGRMYPWGEQFDLAAANIASTRRNAPAPVGSFPRGMTPDSVHDLVGNVWEWTSSEMRPYPGGAPLALAERFYVIRGGAFNSTQDVASAVFRSYARPSTDRADLFATGFRCAMPARQAGAPTPGR